MTVNNASTGLVLVGLGPGGMGGMTLDAVAAARNADHRWYEAYTALWPEDDVVALEQEVGPIERVMRPDIEEPERLLSLARTSKVALLVVGDPLQATTHVDVQLRAADAGVPCTVVHGVSVTGVVTGGAGLSNYRFGRQTTLTYPHGSWIATSPLHVVHSNREAGLHTLVLLDLDPTGAGTGQQQPMRPSDALQSFRLMAQKVVEQGEGPSPAELDGWTVVLCSDVGTRDERYVTTTVAGLEHEAGGRLNCLLVPAVVDGIEADAIARWRR